MWDEGPHCPSRLLSYAALVCSSPASRCLELAPTPPVGAHAADPRTRVQGCAAQRPLDLGSEGLLTWVGSDVLSFRIRASRLGLMCR